MFDPLIGNIEAAILSFAIPSGFNKCLIERTAVSSGPGVYRPRHYYYVLRTATS